MANKSPNILLVEDDDIAAYLATEVLSSDYTVHRVIDGAAALSFVAETLPDLVLLDVLMPGLSGYEVCRVLRNDSSVGDVPIIFLSGKVSEEDRLAGYEAGGDDYLTKPVIAGELRSKVKLAINHYAERRRLKSDIHSAFSTAMIAMSSATEMEAVLQFLRTGLHCQDYAALCHALLNVTTACALETSVQIRGQQGVVSFNAKGPCSPLEESVLNTLSAQGSTFAIRSYVSFSHDHVTLIVKNMPNAEMEPDRSGGYQAKTHNLSQLSNPEQLLAMLAEETNARVLALDDQIMLRQLIANTKDTLHDLDQRNKTQQEQLDAILHGFRIQLESLFQTLELTEPQEEKLTALAQQTVDQVFALYKKGLAVDARIAHLYQQLNKSALCQADLL